MTPEETEDPERKKYDLGKYEKLQGDTGFCQGDEWVEVGAISIDAEGQVSYAAIKTPKGDAGIYYEETEVDDEQDDE